ncbi:FAD binding domain-containing protein [Plantactinospora sp. S1510]|uniref:FAD binding domain-containing protein n=1 Tax=Plantactinospora alkalitolerans TaxID=2789879 RepID=A0ABS0H0Q9_9ACTN|nr:FAD binding domain-containing protein [Plantactinospora alkalitolerans]MBF9132050.1 FAD binding domain-containing protein [Plantactinospora alkalitolerans]
MDFLQPTTWAEALALRAEHPDALPVAGGTDVMVELNFARRRPPALLDLSRVAELAKWDADPGGLRLGAGVPYRRIVTELSGRAPGLAMAARTIGSPQIRNRGTIGGNLGSASPAGDALPPLLAAGATVELASVRGVRRVPVAGFCTGPKRSVLAPDELIAAILLGPTTGPEQFAKVGTRNAMVIAVCSFALVLRMATREVGTGIGSAAPTPVRAPEAEDLLRAELPWDGWGDLPGPLVRRFGELVAAAASPIDDVRGTAAYRRHALGVLARRSLVRAWDEHRSDFPGVGI